MIRIDAHHHLWQLGTRPHAWLDGAGMAAIRRDFTLADLAPLTAAAGIDRTILVQVLPSPAETAEFLALACAQGPVAEVIGWADLTSDRVREALDALRSGPGWSPRPARTGQSPACTGTRRSCSTPSARPG